MKIKILEKGVTTCFLAQPSKWKQKFRFSKGGGKEKGRKWQKNEECLGRSKFPKLFRKLVRSTSLKRVHLHKVRFISFTYKSFISPIFEMLFAPFRSAKFLNWKIEKNALLHFFSKIILFDTLLQLVNTNITWKSSNLFAFQLFVKNFVRNRKYICSQGNFLPTFWF